MTQEGTKCATGRHTMCGHPSSTDCAQCCLTSVIEGTGAFNIAYAHTCSLITCHCSRAAPMYRQEYACSATAELSGRRPVALLSGLQRSDSHRPVDL
jgi:hypothetical protein